MSDPLALVIEDDFDAANIMSTALAAAGYKVETINDGLEARQRLSEAVPHLIALDLHLPNMSGDQLLEQIRADKRLASTRVMLVTADDRLAQRIEGDANLVLLKPVSYSQLKRLAERMRPKLMGR